MNIRLSGPFRLILAALLVLSLQACATRGPEIGTSAPSDASNAAWQAYQSYASARTSDHDPYRLSGSLRYGSQGDTRRVETLLLEQSAICPIASTSWPGIGALVARIQETQDSFTAYAPNENKAIVHQGPAAGCSSISAGPCPSPCATSPRSCAAVFTKSSARPRGSTPAPCPTATSPSRSPGGILPGMLELRPDGLPVRWSGGKGVGHGYHL